MPNREPIETTNLDIYGSPPIPWSRPHDLLAAGGHGAAGTSTVFGVASAEPYGATRWRFD